LNKELDELNSTNELESKILNTIYHSFKLMCSASTNISKWHLYFIDEKLTGGCKSSSNESPEENKNDEEDFTSQNLIQIQQSALMNILTLKSKDFFKESVK
jgi:hypothetical protein